MITLFEEVGEPSRRSLLAQMLSGPQTVTELCKATGLKQANVSNHLARMRRKHIVQREKKGREAYYRVASPEMIEALANLIPASAERSDSIDLASLAELYLSAGLRGDDSSCSKIVDRAIRAGLTLISIDEDILGAALVAADSMLESGGCDEAQEHLLFYITERMVARVAMVRQSFVRLDRTAILASVSGSERSLGLRMVADYLRFAGWRTLYLGNAVPRKDLMHQVEERSPDLIILDLKSHGQEQEALEILGDIDGFRRRGNPCSIGLSGRGAVESSRALLGEGADFVARGLREFAYEILPNLQLPIRPLSSIPYLQ